MPMDAAERVLIPAGQFRDIASPRFRPQGDRIAFMAPGAFVGASPLNGIIGLIGLTPAYAHGFPWDVWIMNADGTDSRRLAELGADDGTLCWSPDGSHIFVYGGTGASLVDVTSGDITRIGFVSGYGNCSWLPET
jgi:Tol biopolymer transport system component